MLGFWKKVFWIKLNQHARLFRFFDIQKKFDLMILDLAIIFDLTTIFL